MPGPGYAFFGDEERRNVLEVLDHWAATTRVRSNPLGDDCQVRRFAREVEDTLGSAYCLPVNSGTSALIAGFAALGIGPGDEVIVPGYMYVASISSIVCSGATPVLAEIDESLTLDPDDVRAKITPNTRAIMAVHMLGASSDMEALQQIASERDICLVEDAAQAGGGSYRSRSLGTFGDVGAFSMNVFKVITGGDGGFLLTDREDVFQRAYSFHHHGWFPYLQETGAGDLLFGLNLRMSEFTAAVARAQLGKLDTILQRTRRLKQDLASLIPSRPGLRRRLLNDPAGDCATVLVYVFDDADAADAVAKGLGTKTLRDSPKHWYGGLRELPMLARETGNPYPFLRNGSARFAQQRYDPGALPRTDDILARSMALTVGLSDAYTGAGFGVDVSSSTEEVVAVAEKFQARVDEVLG